MPASRLLNRFTQNVSIIEFTIPFEPVLPDPGPCQIMLAIMLLECSQVEVTLVDKPEAPDRFDISMECTALRRLRLRRRFRYRDLQRWLKLDWLCG